LDKNKRLFISLAVAIAIATIGLVFLDQGNLTDYFIAAGIIYLLGMLVFFDLNRPSSVKVLNISSVIIFLGFAFYIALKVVNILK
jgi:hypothetical protein